MKKIYMTPQLEVVKIETQGMLALSGGLDTDTTITDPSEFGAREFFGDDESSFFDESSVDYDNF